MIPEQIMAAIPIKYDPVDIHALPPNMAPAIIAIKGIFAPQGINVVVIMVIRRSRSFSMVLDAIIPGIPHPVPISMGIKLFPDNPKRLKTRSSTNATLAIYPQASRNASIRNNTSIWGTNPITAPTPPMIPSTIRLFSQSAHPMESRPLSTSAGIPGTHTP